MSTTASPTKPIASVAPIKQQTPVQTTPHQPAAGDEASGTTIYGYVDCFKTSADDGVLSLTYMIDRPHVTIGRDHRCGIRVNNLRVSRHQCDLEVTRPEDIGCMKAYLTHLTQRPTTAINGELLVPEARTQLEPGTIFRIYDKEFRWRVYDPTVPPAEVTPAPIVKLSPHAQISEVKKQKQPSSRTTSRRASNSTPTGLELRKTVLQKSFRKSIMENYQTKHNNTNTSLTSMNANSNSTSQSDLIQFSEDEPAADEQTEVQHAITSIAEGSDEDEIPFHEQETQPMDNTHNCAEISMGQSPVPLGSGSAITSTPAPARTVAPAPTPTPANKMEEAPAITQEQQEKVSFLQNLEVTRLLEDNTTNAEISIGQSGQSPVRLGRASTTATSGPTTPVQSFHEKESQPMDNSDTGAEISIGQSPVPLGHGSGITSTPAPARKVAPAQTPTPTSANEMEDEPLIIQEQQDQVSFLQNLQVTRLLEDGNITKAEIFIGQSPVRSGRTSTSKTSSGPITPVPSIHEKESQPMDNNDTGAEISIGHQSPVPSGRVSTLTSTPAPARKVAPVQTPTPVTPENEMEEEQPVAQEQQDQVSFLQNLQVTRLLEDDNTTNNAEISIGQSPMRLARTSTSTSSTTSSGSTTPVTPFREQETHPMDNNDTGAEISMAQSPVPLGRVSTPTSTPAPARKVSLAHTPTPAPAPKVSLPHTPTPAPAPKVSLPHTPTPAPAPKVSLTHTPTPASEMEEEPPMAQEQQEISFLQNLQVTRLLEDDTTNAEISIGQSGQTPVCLGRTSPGPKTPVPPFEQETQPMDNNVTGAEISMGQSPVPSGRGSTIISTPTPARQVVRVQTPIPLNEMEEEPAITQEDPAPLGPVPAIATTTGIRPKRTRAAAAVEAEKEEKASLPTPAKDTMAKTAKGKKRGATSNDEEKQEEPVERKATQRIKGSKRGAPPVEEPQTEDPPSTPGPSEKPKRTRRGGGEVAAEKEVASAKVEEPKPEASKNKGKSTAVAPATARGTRSKRTRGAVEAEADQAEADEAPIPCPPKDTVTVEKPTKIQERGAEVASAKDEEPKERKSNGTSTAVAPVTVAARGTRSKRTRGAVEAEVEKEVASAKVEEPKASKNKGKSTAVAPVTVAARGTRSKRTRGAVEAEEEVEAPVASPAKETEEKPARRQKRGVAAAPVPKEEPVVEPTKVPEPSRKRGVAAAPVPKEEPVEVTKAPEPPRKRVAALKNEEKKEEPVETKTTKRSKGSKRGAPPAEELQTEVPQSTPAPSKKSKRTRRGGSEVEVDKEVAPVKVEEPKASKNKGKTTAVAPTAARGTRSKRTRGAVEAEEEVEAPVASPAKETEEKPAKRQKRGVAATPASKKEPVVEPTKAPEPSRKRGAASKEEQKKEKAIEPKAPEPVKKSTRTTRGQRKK